MAPVVNPARRAISWTPARSYPFSENTSAAAVSSASRVGSPSSSVAFVTSSSKDGDYCFVKRAVGPRNADSALVPLARVGNRNQTLEGHSRISVVNRRAGDFQPLGEVVDDPDRQQTGSGVERH